MSDEEKNKLASLSNRLVSVACNPGLVTQEAANIIGIISCELDNIIWPESVVDRIKDYAVNYPHRAT